jgi:dsDNA-specific endonuclease/ATPase MutS2
MGNDEMQTPEKTSFLQEARDDAKRLHQSIEQGLAQGETRMHAVLEQSSAKARDLAKTLKSKADVADTTIKAKMMAAAEHADALAKHGENGRPRPMLEEAQKLTHSISDAVAHIRTHGETGAQK